MKELYLLLKEIIEPLVKLIIVLAFFSLLLFPHVWYEWTMFKLVIK